MLSTPLCERKTREHAGGHRCWGRSGSGPVARHHQLSTSVRFTTLAYRKLHDNRMLTIRQSCCQLTPIHGTVPVRVTAPEATSSFGPLSFPHEPCGGVRCWAWTSGRPAWAHCAAAGGGGGRVPPGAIPGGVLGAGGWKGPVARSGPVCASRIRAMVQHACMRAAHGGGCAHGMIAPGHASHRPSTHPRARWRRWFVVTPVNGGAQHPPSCVEEQKPLARPESTCRGSMDGGITQRAPPAQQAVASR